MMMRISMKRMGVWIRRAWQGGDDDDDDLEEKKEE